MTRGLAIGLFAAACGGAPGSSVDTSGDAPVETSAAGSTSGGPVGSTTAATSTGPVGDAGTTSTSSGSQTSGTDVTGSMPVEDAIERGIAGTLALSDGDLVLLLLMDVMHRRFDVAEFADAASTYDAEIAGLAEPPVDALAFRRIFDPAQTLTSEELDAIAPGVNRVTVPALFCDALPWPAGYAELLQHNASLSGYELTHVALALRWADELGCGAPVDAAFADAIALDSVALVDTSDGIRDLEVEAALFATLLSDDASLPTDLVGVTIAAQLTDGTWPRDPGDTDGNGHTTGLALFLLLELHRRPLDGFVTTGAL